MTSFEATKEEYQLVSRIIERCYDLGIKVDALNMSMDLVACNANGTPLDFQKLLAADEFSFLHDIRGISKHIDRTSGKVTRGFLPRSYRSEFKEAV